MSMQQFVASSDAERSAATPLLLPSLPIQRDRDPIRHILIGSPTSVRQTIHTLHVLHYVEQSFWSRLITVPETGILITPNQGEVISYLVRDRAT